VLRLRGRKRGDEQKRDGELEEATHYLKADSLRE
jgi:hypothetical protein